MLLLFIPLAAISLMAHASEGYGGDVRGADAAPSGAAKFAVTTLADSGPGSLREAVSQPGRSIVFDVAGEIVLKSDLIIRVPYLTIDGSTAPAPGILIRQTGVTTAIEASRSMGEVHEIIVRHLAFDATGTPHGSEKDILSLDGERAAVHHVVIEHCTARASGDGAFDVWGCVYDVSICWNLICDTETALHLSCGDLSQVRERISFHHNLFAQNNERQVRLRHNCRDIEFINNFVFGWGWQEWGGSGLHIAYDAGEVNPSINVVGNVFRHVPQRTSKPDEGIKWERGSNEGEVWFANNIVDAAELDAVPNCPEPKLSMKPQQAATLLPSLLKKAGSQHRRPQDSELLQRIAEQCK
jgi:pectate lyase